MTAGLTWIRRGKGKFHYAEGATVSRANRPMGWWTRCGKHMSISGKKELEVTDVNPDSSYVCRNCITTKAPDHS